MRLTVLGNGPAFPRRGGATSGYLIVQGGTRLLVDCGTGVLSNLQKHVDYHQVTAIVISHMHADHFLDLIPYRYGLRYGACHERCEPPALLLPPGGLTILQQVVAAFAEEPGFFDGVFRVSEYDPAASPRVGDLGIRFARTRHTIPGYAIAVQGGGKKLVFSGDTAPTESVVALARHADLLVGEAGIRHRRQDAPGGAHSTPSEAGDMAARAEAKKLLLTHVWPDPDDSDDDQVVREASQAFGAPVELAVENVTYEV